MNEWYFDFTGRRRVILDKLYCFEEQLSEVTDPRYAQRQVLTLARCEEDGTPVMIKIRYE